MKKRSFSVIQIRLTPLEALSFCAGLWVSLVYLEGSPVSAVALSSVLLLLERDHFLLRGLSETSRYLPPVASVSATLLVYALWDLSFTGRRTPTVFLPSMLV